MNNWTEYNSIEKLALTNDAHKIITKLGPIINKLSDYNDRKSKTENIKQVLTDLGNELNYFVSANGSIEKINRQTGEGREILFDMTWYINKSNEYKIQSVPMVLECELRSENGNKGCEYGEIKYDFRKLLLANADLRVMIFKYRKEEKSFAPLNKHFEECIAECENLPRGARFLFVGFKDNFSSFFYKAMTKE